MLRSKTKFYFCQIIYHYKVDRNLRKYVTTLKSLPKTNHSVFLTATKFY